MKPVLDLTGRRFQRLIVLKQAGMIRKGAAWLCRCNCGIELIVDGRNLQSGNSKSCGCLRIDKTRERSITHGKSHTRTWELWQAMLDRCHYKKGIQFRDYGGRGITVCHHWKKFENFLADMGEAPSKMSIERENNSNGYSPNNCKWATRTEQANNKRNNKRITFNGKTMTVAQWSIETEIPYHTLYQRLFRYGWPFDKALKL